MVRLLCVFMISIIKSKQVNMQQMQLDLQAFCIDFANIKEANQIFKTLQSENQLKTLTGGQMMGGAGHQPGQ